MTPADDAHPYLLTVEHVLQLALLLTDEERRALKAWEAQHLGHGDKGMTDWPGWQTVARRLDH